MKYIKYFIVLYTLFFIIIASANALSALSVPSTQFNQVNNAYFYNCKSADNCGYSHVVGQASLGNWSYWQTEQSDIYTINGSSGMAMAFDTDTGFIKDNYYTVNLLVAASKVPTTSTSNTKKVGVGYSPMFAYENAGSASAMSTTPVAIYWTGDEGSNLLDGKGAILSYTFKATNDGNFVWVSMTTQESTTGYWSLYGYNVIAQGSQAPSAQDIADSLNGQFSSIITDISNLHLTIDNQFTHVNSAIGALGQDLLDGFTNTNENLFNEFDYLEDSLAQGFDNVGNNIDETNNKIDNVNNSINSEDSDTNSSKCGIVCKLKGIWNGIINLPSNIWNFIKGGFDSIIDLFTPPKGDCTLSPNLFDISSVTFEQVFNGTLTKTETGFILKTTYSNSEAYAKVKIGKVSDFSGQHYLSFNSSNASHILIQYCFLKSGSVYPTCSNVSTNNFFDTTRFLSSHADDDLYIYFYGSSAANEEVEFSNIMINKGTEALPYSPYGEETCTGGGTIFDWFGNFFKNLINGILELPSKLVNLLIDGLKLLFIPTDEQLNQIINKSKDLTENFGFVGESMNFFINIFTSLLGLVNQNGCINLPEFSIGETSLFEAHTFWEEQLVCLSDNAILSNNIDTIRTITSIALVCLFVNFASRKFFSVLSKNDNIITSNIALETRGEQ